MANFQLRVSIRSDARIMPEMAAVNEMSLPRYEVVLISPQPTVLIVIMMNHIAFPKDCRDSLLGSDSISIRDCMLMRVTVSTNKHWRGQALKRDLMAKSALSLALYILHIRWALGVQQIEVSTRQLKMRQTLANMTIQNILLRWKGVSMLWAGYPICKTVSLVSKLGWMTSMLISNMVDLKQCQYLFDCLSRISCFVFSSIVLKCLKITMMTNATVTKECIPNIISLSSSRSEVMACMKDSKMQMVASRVRLRVIKLICSCINCV